MKKSIKFTLLAAILSCISSLGLAQETPKLVVENKIVDLGKVPEGVVKNVVFTLENQGQVPLIISAARPTCGCTVADFDREIAPGKTGQVRAKLDTAHFRGPIAKSILVACNDPITPTVALAIKADVRPVLAIYPRPLLRFNLLAKQGASKTVIIAGTERSGKFKLTGAKASSPDISVHYRKLEEKDFLKDAGKPQYEVTVEVSKDAKPGPINATVYLSTNAREQKSVKLQVLGVVRALLRVSPSEISFGAVEAKQAPLKNIILTNNKPGQPVHLTGATISDPAFSLKTTTTEEGKRYQIVVTVKKDAEPGMKDASLRITTDDPEIPVLVVPVKAALR